MKPLYICDIDGTVADLIHRLHFIRPSPDMALNDAMNFKPDWDAFHDHVHDDAPILSVINTVQMLSEFCDIWFFTGRMESCRDKTENWIKDNVLGTSPPIVMRANGDFRSDVAVKKEMLDNMLKIDRDRLIAVFDDRQGIVDMFRNNGIKVFQCAKGDY